MGLSKKVEDFLIYSTEPPTVSLKRILNSRFKLGDPVEVDKAITNSEGEIVAYVFKQYKGFRFPAMFFSVELSIAEKYKLK